MWVSCTCNYFHSSILLLINSLACHFGTVRWSRDVSKMHSDSHHREVVSVQCSKWCLDSVRNVTRHLRQCLTFFCESTVSEAPSFDTCHTAWNSELTSISYSTILLNTLSYLTYFHSGWIPPVTLEYLWKIYETQWTRTRSLNKNDYKKSNSPQPFHVE